MADRVVFFDTTLRDGEQTPGVNLNIIEKVQIARQLERLGVEIIEAGFAASSKGDFEAVQAVAEAVREPVICSMCRAVPGDIEAAAQALAGARRRRIHVVIATSDLHMRYKLKKTPEEVLELTRSAVRLARNYADDVEFSAEDASRSEPEFLYRVLDAAIREGATTVNIPDTVGYSMPLEFEQLIRGIRENVRDIDRVVLAAHCHNDLGLGVACSLAGVRAGVRQLECTINGIGERAGNAALEELAMALKTRGEFYGCDIGLDTRQLMRTSKLISSLTGIDVQPNKAIVGQNAFLHQSGIHQHGVLANRSTYQIINPEDVGVPKAEIVLGKLSGRHAFDEHMREMGYQLTPEELSDAFAKFKTLCDRKKDVSDRDIAALLDKRISEIPDVYTLESYQVFAGNKLTATATITLKRDGEEHVEAAVGTGSVDACFMAIDRLVGMELKLDSYAIKAVTEGADALGEVTVRLRHELGTFMGKGVSTDVVEASILAYVNAVNRIISELGA